MIELIEPIAAFLFLFLLPVLGLCTLPALLMGGFMFNMAEKNKTDKK